MFSAWGNKTMQRTTLYWTSIQWCEFLGCMRRARQRGGNCEVSGILKRGSHALPVPEIYTSEYMSQSTSKNLATLKGFPLIKTLFIK